MGFNKLLLASAATLSLAACTTDSGTSDPVDPTGAGESEVIGKEGGKADAWDSRNNPEIFARFLGKELNKTLAELPRKGEATDTPWAGDYWATYKDSSNHRYLGNGELSPLEKYDVAFNGWTPPEGFMDLRPYNPANCEAGFDPEYYKSLGPAARFMSENKGNKPTRDKVYRNGEGTEPVCDQETKDAVETWFGLCHAWAPAAILEPEPLHPVEVNGQTFYSSDIKALILTVYDSTDSVILGGRCNTKEVERDETGRIKDPACRDTNAGSFHVIMSNLLGRYGMPLVEDRTYDYEVWNQPVRSFEVTQMTEIDVARANELLNVEGDEYKYNPKAVKFFEVFATVAYITESSASRTPNGAQIDRYTRKDNYKYILEIDAAGEIIGGEWLQGRTNHPSFGISEQPDFLWVSTGPRSNFRVNPNVTYAKVKELINKSRLAPTSGNGESKVFTNETVTEIPDNNAEGISSTVTVPNTVSGEKVSLQLDILHTYIGDLVVTLEHSNGYSEILHDKEGRSADNLSKLYPLADLSNEDLKGTFTLHVSDNAKIDTGKLVRWSIIVE